MSDADLLEAVLDEALEDWGIEDVTLTLEADGVHVEVLCSTNDMRRDAGIRSLAELGGGWLTVRRRYRGRMRNEKMCAERGVFESSSPRTRRLTSWDVY